MQKDDTTAFFFTLFFVTGIAIDSTGKCSDRNNKNCTSFDGIRKNTIYSIIAFKKSSNCEIIIFGGSEVGCKKN